MEEQFFTAETQAVPRQLPSNSAQRELLLTNLAQQGDDMNHNMTEAELRMFVNYHRLNQLVGKHHRIVTDCLYHLNTAKSAFRTGHHEVTKERLDLVLEYLTHLMTLKPDGE
jgi:hypothetical protein